MRTTVGRCTVPRVRTCGAPRRGHSTAVLEEAKAVLRNEDRAHAYEGMRSLLKAALSSVPRKYSKSWKTSYRPILARLVTHTWLMVTCLITMLFPRLPWRASICCVVLIIFTLVFFIYILFVMDIMSPSRTHILPHLPFTIYSPPTHLTTSPCLHSTPDMFPLTHPFQPHSLARHGKKKPTTTAAALHTANSRCSQRSLRRTTPGCSPRPSRPALGVRDRRK